MIPTHSRAPRARLHQRLHVLLDAPKRVLNGQRIHRKIPKVRYTMFRERIDLQYRVPRTDEHGLVAHLPRPEPRSRPVSGPTVEWNSHQRNIQVLRVADVRQAHERGNSARTRM